MKKSKSKSAIAKVALQHGVSEDEVRREIQIAIDMAMANSDPAIQAKWAAIPRKGKKPTPEEAIFYLADLIKNEVH